MARQICVFECFPFRIFQKNVDEKPDDLVVDHFSR